MIKQIASTFISGNQVSRVRGFRHDEKREKPRRHVLLPTSSRRNAVATTVDDDDVYFPGVPVVHHATCQPQCSAVVVASVMKPAGNAWRRLYGQDDCFRRNFASYLRRWRTAIKGIIRWKLAVCCTSFLRFSEDRSRWTAFSNFWLNGFHLIRELRVYRVIGRKYVGGTKATVL